MITKFEKVNCPACQSNQSQVIAKPLSHHPEIKGEFSVVQCLDCGLKYLNPRPSPESLGEFYEILNQKSASKSNNQIVDQTHSNPNLIKRIWHKLNYSDPLLPLIDREPILDIGCGKGDLLLELSKRGYQAHGLELNSEAVEDCLQKGLTVTQASIESYVIPQDQYQCFVLSHALEHFLDPVAILTKLKEALPRNGKIVIAVPYAKSPMIALFGNNWHGWDPPFHITHFDKNTIRQVCEKAGLKLKTVYVKGHPEDFTRSLILKTQQPKRYLILRALLLPIFWGIEQLGSGSYLLASAIKK